MPDTSHASGARAVFLSYAREDADAARRIADALRAFGVEVWFDQSELRGGDTWDQKIRRQIKECALFMPVISATTQARGEGYFRREWRLGVDRTHDMSSGVAFIVPVVIDDTPENGAEVPEEFMRYQWTRLAHGVPSSHFVEQVKRLLSKEQGARNRERDGTRAPAGAAVPAKNSKSWLMPVIVSAVIAAGLAFFMLRKPAPAPAPTAAPVATASEPVAAKPAPMATDKSIAVIPFTNMSEEKEANAFFSDGIHEDILTNLALIRELRVVSRTSVLSYRNTTKSMKQIAQELGVTYILEGSVRRVGNKVRVTGQLIHAATDEHVWAQAYDRDLTDIFAIQTELSSQIAGALKAALSPEEKIMIARRPTENLAAYDAYLKARQLRQASRLTNPDIEPALQQAVKLDPGFAEAWAELGSFHAQVYFSAIDHSVERLAKAKAAIDTAMRLAPNVPEVIEKLGDYYYYGFRDYARAIEQYQRLAVLRPNDAVVFGSMGLIHRRQGRWDEAVAELRRAFQLEPRNQRYAKTLMQLLRGLNRFDEALAVQRQIVALHPGDLLEESIFWSTSLQAGGQFSEAREWLARAKPAPGDEPLALALRKSWARGFGDWENAIKLDQQQRYYDGFGEPHWSQDISAAFVLQMHGDTAAARERAEQGLAGGKIELEQQPSAETWAGLSQIYVVLGNKAEAFRCAQKAKDLMPESTDAVAGPLYSGNYLRVQAWFGEKDQAVAELARVLRTPYGDNIYFARTDPTLSPLFGDPRFQALVNDPKNNAPLF